MKATFLGILLAPLLALSVTSSLAVDTSSPPPANDKLSAARTKIAAKDWPGAVDELKRANDPASADAAESERYYNEALRIDPKHKGALEYSGELYLMMGDLPKAEQRLTALDKACFLPCSEYKDLKNAVAKYKANGNKYVGDW